MPGGRLPLLVTLAVLLVALAVVLLLTTPWNPLASATGAGGAVPADPGRDFAPGEIAREDAFHRQIRPPAYLGLATALLVALGLGLTPLGARLVGAVARPFGGGWAWQIILGGIVVALLARLASLPFNARAEVVARRYGLSTQDWPGWALDRLKGFGLSAAVLLLVLFGLYTLVRVFPRGWWIPSAVGGALLVIVLSFVYPLVVEPVFNKFTPMSEGQTRSALLELARRDGLAVDDVLVADASRRTTSLNAYVSGFGSTRRIVVYDTTLRSASTEEVRLIVAHELGHAKRNDVLYGTLVGAMGFAAGVCLLGLVVSTGPVLRRAGVESLRDPRSLALVLAVTAVMTTLSGPVQMLVSRRIEARADVHSLELTRDPAAFAQMQRRLAVTNLTDLNPHPVVYGLFRSHPTPPERIALARTWASATGVPPPPDLAPREQP